MKKENAEKNQAEGKKRKNPLYRFIKWSVSLFYKKRKVIGIENLPQEPSLIIGNHAQMHGPLYCELYFPTPKKVWCIGEMLKMKEVPAYAYKDFWSYKPKWSKWFYKILSYLIAPVFSFILSHADTIGVYKDARVISTFKATTKALKEGDNVVIFPERAEDYNEILCEFQTRFVDVAKLYYKQSGKRVSFVPMYHAASIKTVIFGKPIEYDPEMEMEAQRAKICEYLKEEITRLAKELPQHKVVPYKNIKKKDYPYSK